MNLIVIFDEQGLDVLYTLKYRIDHVNEMFCNHFLAYYLDVIAFMCQIPGTLQASKVSPSSVIFYVAINFCTCIIAAEFHAFVKLSFMKWCKACNSHYRDNGIRMKLVGIKNEMHFEPIALSCKFFTITYGFLVSVRIHFI